MSNLEEAISNHPFLIGMRPADVALVAHGAEELEFEAGEVIFREGEPANRLYLIQTGKVVLEARKGSRTGTLQKLQGGDVLGWSWLFPPFTWHFTAIATEPVRVFACNGGHLLVACEENPAFGYELMKRVAQIMIHRVEASQKDKPRNPDFVSALT